MLTKDGYKLIQVAIVDDHELVRRGLRLVLEEEADIEVVFEASDGCDALDMVAKVSPDVVLLDLHMPGTDGIEVCRQVVQGHPGTRVLVLTSFDSDDEVFGALSAGAAGYLMKDVAPDELVRTIRGVAAGQTVLDPSISQRVINGRPQAERHQLLEELSDREMEVLGLMAKGLNNREIAKELWIGQTTVKTHVSHILKKLGQRDRTQAVVTAIKAGLVEQDEAE